MKIAALIMKSSLTTPKKSEVNRMFRYFIQPQLNKFNNSIIGYELLIRKFIDGHWQLPENFAAVPINAQITLLKATVARLSLKVNSVSLNLNRQQFLDADLAQAIIDTQRLLFPVALVIEITEEPNEKHFSSDELLTQANRFADYGIQLSLDDVGTGRNNLENIQPLLPIASEMKFAMQNFRRLKRTAEIPAQIKKWQAVAEANQLRFVLEGIENPEEDQMADQLEVSLRQGYFYGQPHLLKLDLTNENRDNSKSVS